jgi:hypothetical protein
MTYTTDRTALKLNAFLQRWLLEHTVWAHSQPGWYYTPRAASDIANELLQDAEFNEIKLGSWLQSPDGVLIQTVVGQVLPQPYSIEFSVLVEAISLAAQAQRDNDRGLAAGLTVVGAATLVLLLLGILRWSHEGGTA